MQKRICLISCALLAPSLFLANAEAQPLRVVNAASYNTTSVAPGSIVTIFGTGLATGTAAVTDPAHPPVTLGGTSVSIGGQAAALFYVSPTQINAVVAAATPTGTEPVVVTSTAGTVNGTAVIDVNSPPGLFSLTGTGTHDGAIIQSLTGRVGAFTVKVGPNATFLSLFLTGANLTTKPTVTVGGVSVNVAFAGVSPCCAGLEQINITLPDSLAGAGRVPVLVQAGGQTSNVTEIVILPQKGEGEFDDDKDNETRSRELSAIAYIPGTSLALLADENDDVIREVDLAGKTVLHTIALSDNSEPAAIAVNSAGTLAVVAERTRSKVAIIDIALLKVKAEVAVGAGPVSVAISGNQAIVVNGDGQSVTVVDLTTNTASPAITVGSGPRGVALDAAGHAYVTNQNDGTISVIDLATNKVTSTLSLGVSTRPASIQIITGTTFAIVSDPATTDDGKVLVVNLTTGATTVFNVNPDHSGGSSDIVMVGTTAYIANQGGGSIAVLPLTISGTTVTGTATKLAVDQGVRSLAIDTKDNWLLAVNESGGKIVVVSLASGEVIARINAVAGSSSEEDDDSDDHSDHDNAPNLPHISSVLPINGKVGTTFTITITGTNFTGATSVVFVNPAISPTPGKGKALGLLSVADTAFTVTGIAMNAAGTQVTATVAIAATAAPGLRLVRVSSPNGDSAFNLSTRDSFTVLP